MAVQPGLCGTWSEIPKTGFLTTRLIFLQINTEASMKRLSRPDNALSEPEMGPQFNGYVPPGMTSPDYRTLELRTLGPSQYRVDTFLTSQIRNNVTRRKGVWIRIRWQFFRAQRGYDIGIDPISYWLISIYPVIRLFHWTVTCLA